MVVAPYRCLTLPEPELIREITTYLNDVPAFSLLALASGIGRNRQGNDAARLS